MVRKQTPREVVEELLAAAEEADRKLNDIYYRGDKDVMGMLEAVVGVEKSLKVALDGKGKESKKLNWGF